jgi:predicted nuclease with TOPRIM domain
VPQRGSHPPPPESPENIDDVRRENERLREDLRRSEAERQRLRRENEKLKEELVLASALELVDAVELPTEMKMMKCRSAKQPYYTSSIPLND